MPKEPTPEKLMPTRRTPRRGEHFAPVSETVPSRELDPEQRMIAREQGALEEPGPEPERTEPEPGVPPARELPGGVTRGYSEAHVPRAPVQGQRSAGVLREQRAEDNFAPVQGGIHRTAGGFVPHGSHGKHGRKPDRPKGAATIRKSAETEAE